jgi:hypothetical protein
MRSYNGSRRFQPSLLDCLPTLSSVSKGLVQGCPAAIGSSSPTGTPPDCHIRYAQVSDTGTDQAVEESKANETCIDDSSGTSASVAIPAHRVSVDT